MKIEEGRNTRKSGWAASNTPPYEFYSKSKEFKIYLYNYIRTDNNKKYHRLKKYYKINNDGDYQEGNKDDKVKFSVDITTVRE